jgi:ABC-type phosphate transport system ATPase subunit
LLLDEPTASLDPESSKAIEQLIQSFQQKITSIFVTHNLEQAKRICNRIIIIDEGKIVRQDDNKQATNNNKLPMFSHLIPQI